MVRKLKQRVAISILALLPLIVGFIIYLPIVRTSDHRHPYLHPTPGFITPKPPDLPTLTPRR